MGSIIINSGASCVSCSKCIKQCVVKSIHHDGLRAGIDNDRCVTCGSCVDVCPSDYIHVRGDIAKVKKIVQSSKMAVASISPQWMAEFPDIDPCRMIEALNLLGFKAVSQTSAAVPYMTSTVLEQYNSASSMGVYLSSICPVITSMVEKYHHNSVARLIPVPSLSVLHARMLKSYYGNDIDVVTISGCIADKSEIGRDGSSDISAAITFEELVEWLRVEKIDFDMIPGNSSYEFEPRASSPEYHRYVVSGGLFNTRFSIKEGIDRVEFLTVTGVERVRKLLVDIDYKHIANPLFLDLYACEGGCLSSPESLVRREITAKNMNFTNRVGRLTNRDKSRRLHRSVIVNSSMNYAPKSVVTQVSSDDIAGAYERLRIDSGSRITNCGACGYSTCHDFAVAMVSGNAVSDMCLWCQYESVSERFEAYIRTSRSGIFIVDEKMRIVQSNKIFATLFGVDTLMAYEDNSDLKGVDITGIVPFHKSISALLTSQDTDVLEQDIEIKGLMLKVTLIALHGQKKVCGFVRNLFMNDVAREEIISRTRQVIDDNLATIQKIAYLLGDTASQTEAVLNSIIESQNEDYE